MARISVSDIQKITNIINNVCKNTNVMSETSMYCVAAMSSVVSMLTPLFS